MRLQGLTGSVSSVRVARPAAASVRRGEADGAVGDLDLVRMAGWAMNYLARTPRPHLDWEPVFQCHPLRCPPVPEGHDVVVPCDTDARMQWEWFYMRDVSGLTTGQDVEAAFHRRMRGYIDGEGKVWSPPGSLNESAIDAIYEKKDYILHIWGATKILLGLSEGWRRWGGGETRSLARKVMLALKGLAHWGRVDGVEVAWFPSGMGALKADGTPLPNGWNMHPAPIVEPLLVYAAATGDAEAIDFARAYTEGILRRAQPEGLPFAADGSFGNPLGHSHAVMHALWGVAHLGELTGEGRYRRLAKGAWDWMRSRGTGTGWFPAMPDSCNETCCISDMISVALLIARDGHPEYYDYAERYLRNYIANLQFLVTPAFEAYYRKLHADKPAPVVEAGLQELRKFQGGIIGGSGLNDWENELLGGVSGFEMFGCCAPEGMRAIHTAWINAIERRVGGVYVNLGVNRLSEWGRVISSTPEEGRLTVNAKVTDTFHLRPPHWVAPESLRLFVNTHQVSPRWERGYVVVAANAGDELVLTYPLLAFTHTVSGLWPQTAPGLELTFRWLGNMVVDVDPRPRLTPLFTGKPPRLPPPPVLDP